MNMRPSALTDVCSAYHYIQLARFFQVVTSGVRRTVGVWGCQTRSARLQRNAMGIFRDRRVPDRSGRLSGCYRDEIRSLGYSPSRVKIFQRSARLSGAIAPETRIAIPRRALLDRAPPAVFYRQSCNSPRLPTRPPIAPPAPPITPLAAPPTAPSTMPALAPASRACLLPVRETTARLRCRCTSTASWLRSCKRPRQCSRPSSRATNT